MTDEKKSLEDLDIEQKLEYLKLAIEMQVETLQELFGYRWIKYTPKDDSDNQTFQTHKDVLSDMKDKFIEIVCDEFGI